jgi:hypothetical protein
MWIRSQDRKKLLQCNNVHYEHKEKYTDRYIALEEDVKRNFGNYTNPKTNARIQNRYEALEYLDNHKEYDDLYIIRTYIQDDSELLGSYETEERALEVLDEIQRNIIDSNVTQYEYYNSQDGLKTEYTYKLKIVYEMPKE